MPELSRPQSIPIGQLGNIARVTPKDDNPQGIGGVLQKAAQSIFGAQQTLVDTGTKMAAAGAGSTQLGIQLMEPFKKIKDSREVLQSDDLAIRAQKTMREQVNIMQRDGSHFSTWPARYREMADAVTADALTKAGGLSSAAWEHVYGILQKEDLSLSTELIGGATKSDLAGQVEMIKTKEDFSLEEALKSDEQGAALHRKSLSDALDKAVFSTAITPGDRQQKLEYWDKRYFTNRGIQIALSKDVDAARAYLNKTSLLPDDNLEAMNKAEAAVRFRTVEVTRLERAAEKQLTVDQAEATTAFANRLTLASEPSEIIKTMFKFEEYVKQGIIGPTHGTQLVGLGKQRLDELLADKPVRDEPGVADVVMDRIVANPMSLEDADIRKIPGLTIATSNMLMSARKERLTDGHYSKLKYYDLQRARITVLRRSEIDELSYDIRAKAARDAKQPIPPRPTNYNEQVETALRTYEDMVMGLVKQVGQPLTNTDLLQLDKEVDRIVGGIKDIRFSDTPGDTLQQMRK